MNYPSLDKAQVEAASNKQFGGNKGLTQSTSLNKSSDGPFRTLEH